MSLPEWREAFRSPASKETSPPEFILDAVINAGGVSRPVHAVCLENGEFALSNEDWQELHLRAVAPVTLADGQLFRPLNAIAGSSYRIDHLNQAVEIAIPAAGFLGNQFDARPSGDTPPPPAPWGAYLSYDAVANVDEHALRGYGAAINSVVFGPVGRVESGGYLTGDTDGPARFVRTQTFFERNDVERMTVLTVGDAIGVGGTWSRPVRFAGIRFARDFSTRPGFITFPMPSLSGSAALPSTVDVLVNNVRRLTQNIAAGPFDIGNVPVVNGAGQLQMIVRDPLGRESVISQPYYADAQMLARGLTAFSFEAGWQRLNYGVRSFDYGSPVVSATFRWGASERLTLETRAEGETGRAALGLGLRTSLGSFGVVSAAGGYARADGNDGLTTNLGFQTLGRRITLSAMWQHATAGYRPFALSPGEERLRDQVSMGGGVNLGAAGSLTTGYIRQSSWNGPIRELITGSWSRGLGPRLRIGAQSSVDLRSRRWQVGLRVSLRLGQYTDASADLDRDRQGWAGAVRISNPNYSRPGFGWNFRAATDGSSISGGGSYNAEWARLTADAAVTNGEFQGRLGMAGAIGVIDGAEFVSRPIRNSFVLVRAGGIEGVTVNRWNQPAAVTNRRGIALIGDVEPYQSNKISIDPSAIPLDVEIGETSFDARAWPGAGAIVDIPLRRSIAFMVRVHLPDRTPLPQGAVLQIDGAGQANVLEAGRIWISGIPVQNAGQHRQLEARWEGGSCVAVLVIPTTTAPEMSLGDLTCKPV